MDQSSDTAAKRRIREKYCVLVPHPNEARALVVPGAQGWALPEFVPEREWPDLPEALAAIRAQLHLGDREGAGPAGRSLPEGDRSPAAARGRAPPDAGPAGPGSLSHRSGKRHPAGLDPDAGSPSLRGVPGGRPLESAVPIERWEEI